MDKDISMGKTAECVLLQNHEKQKYTKMQEDSSVVELFVYEEVSVRYISRVYNQTSFFLPTLVQEWNF